MKKWTLLLATFILFCLLISTQMILLKYRPNFERLDSIHVVRIKPNYENYTLIDKFREDYHHEDRKQIYRTQPKVELGTNDKWRLITSMVHIYSAHVDSRLPSKEFGNFVKVIGLGPMRGPLPNITCVLHYRSMLLGQSPLKVYYKIDTMFPWKEQTLDSFVFMCELPDEEIPKSISFHSANDSPTRQIAVRQRSYSNYQRKFSVCVQPLNLQFDDADAIRHFITVNSYFGAEHFYFYNLSVSEEVNDLLTRLQSRGLVTIFQWNLGDMDNKIHSSAQKAMNNHCILHNINLSRYVVMIDIDEVFVPQYQKRDLVTIPSWNDVLISDCSESDKNVGAYVIQSQLFPHGLDQMSGQLNLPKHFWSIDALYSTVPYPLYQWSKVMVDTERVDIMDIHNVNQMLPSYTVCNVSSEVAIVHHYRYIEVLNSYPTKLNLYMKRFEKQLLYNYRTIFKI